MDKKQKTIILIGILIFVLLVVIIAGIKTGNHFLEKASAVQEYVQNPPAYRFSIYIQAKNTTDPKKSNTINTISPSFYYDLTTKEATFKTYIKDPEEVQYIVLFSEKINLQKISCSITHGRDEIMPQGPHNYIPKNYSKIDCFLPKNISTYNNYTRLGISLNNTILANQTLKVNFVLDWESSFTFTLLDHWSENANGNIIINTGKIYNCFSDCLYNLNKFSISKYTDNPAEERRLSLNFSNNSGMPSFQIITQSTLAEENKNKWMSWGVSIITGSIFAAIALLIEIIKYSFELIKENQQKTNTKKLSKKTIKTKRKIS